MFYTVLSESILLTFQVFWKMQEVSNTGMLSGCDRLYMVAEGSLSSTQTRSDASMQELL